VRRLRHTHCQRQTLRLGFSKKPAFTGLATSSIQKTAWCGAGNATLFRECMRVEAVVLDMDGLMLTRSRLTGPRGKRASAELGTIWTIDLTQDWLVARPGLRAGTPTAVLVLIPTR